MKDKRSVNRAEIESRINSVNSEIADLWTEKQSQNEQLKHYRAKLEQVEERLSQKTSGGASLVREGAWVKPGVNEVYLSPEEKATLDAARNAVNTGIAACNQLEALITDKELVLEALTKEKSLIVCSSAADEVISFKAQKEQLKGEITLLQGLITNQEKNISSAEQSIPPVRDLTTKRAEILADIAIGKATQNDLDSIDALIRTPDDESAAARSQAKQTIADANQTISGLRVKLEKAEMQLKGLEARWPNVINDFLTAEAENIGEEYLQAFKNLEANFRRLIALDRIITRNGLKTICLGRTNEISIPAFNLKSHEEKRGKVSDYKWFLQLVNTAGGHNIDKREEDITAEINRWKTAGIVL